MKTAISDHQRSAMSVQRNARRARATSLAASRRGFSLVELVVVIAIILLLMGLTLAVTTSLTRGSESRQTEDTLRLLDAAYQAWKATSDRDVSYGNNGNPPGAQYEILLDDTPDADSSGSNDHDLTDQLLTIINRNAQAKEMLARINPKFLRQHDDDELGVIDAWDTEILVIFPGRLWNTIADGPPPSDDPDGTVRTEFEYAYGVCPNRQVVFLSAGPDGRFGNLSFGSPSQQEIDEAADNLSSQPLGDPTVPTP